MLDLNFDIQMFPLQQDCKSYKIVSYLFGICYNRVVILLAHFVKCLNLTLLSSLLIRFYKMKGLIFIVIALVLADSSPQIELIEKLS